MMEIKRHNLDSRQLGAGLVEVMVSLVILGVGLLGVLSLQANGLNSNQRAQFSSEAQVLAQDMVDRILAFGSVDSDIAASNIANAGADAGQYGTTDTTAAVNDPACGSPATGGCSAVGTVAFDQREWQTDVNNSSLPSGRGTVTWAGGTRTYTIRLEWDQDRTGATGRACNSNDKTVNLTCFDLQVRL